jgi:hypothetical protein
MAGQGANMHHSETANKTARCGVIEQFTLKLGTEEEPTSLSNALRELRRHLDRAKVKTWAYADPMWTDESRSGVKVVFPDTRAAEIAVRNW